MRFTDGVNVVILEDSVLSHFEKYKQLGRDDLEAGGLLYIKRNTNFENVYRIRHATGPIEPKERTRYSFVHNIPLENIEIKKYYNEGYDYVGDWHTHPEPTPIISQTDFDTVRSSFLKTKHSLDYLVMIIVGQTDFPDGLKVSLHNGDSDNFLQFQPNL